MIDFLGHPAAKIFLGLPSAKIIEWLKRPFFNITVSSSSLEMGAADGSGTYRMYEIAKIQAIPNTGYMFKQWSDGNTDAIRNLYVTKDLTLTADFQVKKTIYTLTIVSNDSSLGTTYGSGNYNEGVVVEIRAVPTNIGLFVRWNDGDINQTRQVVVTADKTYIAIFENKYGDIYYKPNY